MIMVYISQTCFPDVTKFFCSRFHRNQPVIVECRDTGGKFSGVITAIGTQEVCFDCL